MFVDLQPIAFTPILVLLAGGLLVGAAVGRLRPAAGWLAVLTVALAAFAYTQSATGQTVEWLRLPGGVLSLTLAGDELSRLFTLTSYGLALLLLLLDVTPFPAEQGRLPAAPTSDANLQPTTPNPQPTTSDPQPSIYNPQATIFNPRLAALLLLAGLTLYYAAGDWLTLVFGWAVSAAAAWLVYVAEAAEGEGSGRVLGASFVGLTLLGVAVYVVRLSEGAAFAGLPAAVFANPVVLVLLLLAVVGGLSLWPLYWLGGDGGRRAGWPGRGLVLAVTAGWPEMYLLLRVERFGLPDWWYGWLLWLGGAGAIMAGLLALRAQSAADIADALAVSGAGLAVFSFGLHTPTATLAALWLMLAVALGRALLAVGMVNRLFAPFGLLTLLAVPPFAAFPAFWLICNAAVANNPLLLWLPLGWLVLALAPATALLVEADRQRLSAAGLLGAGLLAIASLGLGSAGGFVLNYLAGVLGVATVPLPAWADGLPAVGGLLLLALLLTARARRNSGPREAMAAADVLAPVADYLRFADFLHPRAWGTVLAGVLQYVAELLADINRRVEGRYYLLASALLLLVALLVISRL